MTDYTMIVYCLLEINEVHSETKYEQNEILVTHYPKLFRIYFGVYVDYSNYQSIGIKASIY